jgi:chitin synthase
MRIISWGTKGIDAASDLAVVVTTKNSKGETVASVELPGDSQDADAQWEAVKKEVAKEAASLRDRKDKGPSSTQDEDFFKQFRTNIVIMWLITNGILCYIFTSPAVVAAIFPSSTSSTGTTKRNSVNPYLTFLFWSVALLSLIRFICSTVYMFGWWSEWLEDSGKRNPVKSLVHETKVLAGKEKEESA